jgi:hypothetical protein
VRKVFNEKDSISNYIDVIEKHGYTKEQMDATMKYYFVNDPKKLQKIYDQVVAKLTEMQSGLEAKSPLKKVFNLWNQKTSFNLPADGVHNPLFFSIPVKDTGMYTLSFTCVLFTDDKSLYPRTTIYFWHTDDTEQGVRNPWDKIDLIRDGLSHDYSISRRLADTTFTHISGWLFDCDQQSIRWEKHAGFSNIILFKGQIE